MSVQTQIACPDCGSPIYIESTLLLAGQSFKCTNDACGLSLSLASSDKDKVAKAYDEFEAIRREATQQAGNTVDPQSLDDQ